MSTVRFELTGRLTAFHVSEAAGVVVCMQADLSGLDQAEIAQIGPNMEASISVSVEIPGTDPEAEAES